MTEQLNAVENLDIGQLRKAAALLEIKAEKHWRKEDFIEAIKAKQSNEKMVNAVFDTNLGPAPGFARVLIHRDPTPNHKNGPIHLGVNGRIIAVPRGAAFDIPIPYVEVLHNAITTVTREANGPSRENPTGSYMEEPQTSYPFQVLAITPGVFKNSHDNRAAKYAKKKQFFDKYGHWPTEGELKEFEKLRMAKDMRDE